MLRGALQGEDALSSTFPVKPSSQVLEEMHAAEATAGPLRDHRALCCNVDDYARMVGVPCIKGANFRAMPGVITHANGKSCEDLTNDIIVELQACSAAISRVESGACLHDFADQVCNLICILNVWILHTHHVDKSPDSIPNESLVMSLPGHSCHAAAVLQAWLSLVEASEPSFELT